MENISRGQLLTAQAQPLSYLFLFLKIPNLNYSLKFPLPLRRSSHVLLWDETRTKTLGNTGRHSLTLLILKGMSQWNPLVTKSPGLVTTSVGVEWKSVWPALCPESFRSDSDGDGELGLQGWARSGNEWLPEQEPWAGPQAVLTGRKEEMKAPRTGR